VLSSTASGQLESQHDYKQKQQHENTGQKTNKEAHKQTKNKEDAKKKRQAKFI
jgi:hypothetical protein